MFIIFSVLFIMAVLYFVLGWNNDLVITRQEIKSEKIKSEIKIAFLSDLHSGYHGEGQRDLIDKIKTENPDLIVMAGDMMDDDLPDKGTIDLLEGVAADYPCFYVTGNHEFRSGRADDQKDIFRSYGVKVLEGGLEKLEVEETELCFFGVDDPSVGETEFKRQLTSVGNESKQAKEEGLFSILLSHRPELFQRYAEFDFDLVLSGHAHGGQWRVPLLLPNGLYSPNQGLFPKYTTGLHEENGTKMIVSRGMPRGDVIVPRLFNPPELIIIELKPQ